METIIEEKRKPLPVPPELDEFAERVGEFIEYWGFKNVQGRIWAHLYLSELPLDTHEIMRRTGISKGLASLYIREMLEYRVILEAGRGPNGTVLYSANPDQQDVIYSVLRRRERALISKTSTAWRLCNSIPEDERKKFGISKDRLKDSGDLIRDAETVLDLFLRSRKPLHILVRKISQMLKTN